MHGITRFLINERIAHTERPEQTQRMEIIVIVF